ncbi:hypothetical protein pipiens_006804 [Culex pipiens pipiens]|uniref:Uncharacterized protein n=1 Tax=Culex pipiens pipiens TaxID=38569 RepID=A0ABD1DQK3_CULPP
MGPVVQQAVTEHFRLKKVSSLWTKSWRHGTTFGPYFWLATAGAFNRFASEVLLGSTTVFAEFLADPVERKFRRFKSLPAP